jgi:hypothetical protein
MRASNSKSSHNGASNKKNSKRGDEMPMSMPLGGELLWWPYRAVARFMLPNCRSAVAALQIGRQFADEIREAVRREQDLLFHQSENLLQMMCAESRGAKATSQPFAPETVEEFYNTTMSGVREMTKAMTDAQVRSLNGIREYPSEPSAGKGDDNDRTRKAA